MKTTLFFLICALVSLNSCNFNKSINENLNTGAISKGNGLSCDNIDLDINGEIESRNAFVDGERITINFNDMKGLTKVGGKFFFGLSMVLKSKSGNVIDKQDDLFTDSKGYDIDPITPMAYFNAIFDEAGSKDYVLKIKIWDKKGKGTFTYEMPYTVSPNRVLTVADHGLKSESVSMYNVTGKFKLAKKELNATDEYGIEFKNTDGITDENGKSYVAVSLKATDNSGKVLLDYDNLYKSYEETGIPADDAAKNLTITFTLGQTKIQNPVRIESVFKDLKSDKSIVVKTKVDCQN